MQTGNAAGQDLRCLGICNFNLSGCAALCTLFVFGQHLVAFKGKCMTKFGFALLLTAFVSTAAMAQAPAPIVGVAESVQGLVTVSQGNTLGNLVKDSNVANGARVVTTSTGSAVLKLRNGCIINLAANQAVTIDSSLDCKALVAGVQSTGAVAGGAGVGAGGFNAAAAWGLGVAATAVISHSNSDNSNPPPRSSRS